MEIRYTEEGSQLTLPDMLGKGTEKAQEQEERDESTRKKYLPFSPGVEKNPSREKVRNHPPGRKRREGKERGGGERDRVKPQGSEVTQYFIHRSSPE